MIVMLKRIFSAPRRVYIVELSEPPKALPKEASLRCKRISPHMMTARTTCIQGIIWAKVCITGSIAKNENKARETNFLQKSPQNAGCRSKLFKPLNRLVTKQLNCAILCVTVAGGGEISELFRSFC